MCRHTPPFLVLMCAVLLLGLGTACNLVLPPFLALKGGPAFTSPPRPQVAPFSEPYAPPPVTPNALEPGYEEHLGRVLFGGNPDRWEAAAHEAHYEGGYYPWGSSQGVVFNSKLRELIRSRISLDPDNVLGFFDDWERMHPDSGALEIVRIRSMVQLAWHHRGTSLAHSVTQEGWEGFYHYLKMAEETALAALERGNQHPDIYARLLTIGTGLGYDEQEIVDIFLAGLRLDPMYRPLYGGAAMYFQEKWYGRKSQWPALMDAAVAATWTRTGNAAAGMLTRELDRLGTNIFDLPESIPWEALVDSDTAYARFFPEDWFFLNYMAKLACAYDQPQVAVHYFRTIADQPHQTIWPREMFEAWRGWALEGAARPESQEIHLAVDAGHVGRVRRALEDDAAATAVNEFGRTPLMLAMGKRNWEIVRMLLNRGADPNSSYNDQALLYAVVRAGEVELAERLIEAGADPNSTNRNNWTCLQEAARRGNVEMLRTLLSAPGILIDYSGEEDYWPPLHQAAHHRHLDAVKVLVEHGAQVDVRNQAGATPLIIAVRAQERPIVDYLLEYGADPFVLTDSGWNGLVQAVDVGNKELVDLFVELGFPVNRHNDDGWSALHMAVMNGDLEMLEHLRALGGDIMIGAAEGRSLLYQAIRADRLEILAHLIEEGMPFDLLDHRGETPLQSATRQEREEIAAYLRQYDTDALAAF